MIITTLQYGLGNQLFQYAAGRALAERLHAPLFVDAVHYHFIRARELEITKFNVRLRFLPNFLAKMLMREHRTNPLKSLLTSVACAGIHVLNDEEKGYDPRVKKLGWFSCLDGLWQSEHYFADIRPQLLKELEPREPLPTLVSQFIERVKAEPSVALHVRRGDLVADPHYAETVGALGPDYYHAALTRLQERFPDARVYVFSDDPAWCAEHLPTMFPTEIVSGRWTHSPVEDFAAMKACRHFVIANSTFSWWTAWLGTHPEKRVIAPARFFRVSRAWESDLLPASWEKIEPAFLPWN